jgi:predicted GIY-YIG superfamily endonuclease
MFYVYILKSTRDNSKYVGVTTDLKKRVIAHNSGSNKYSASKKPFKLIWYCAFSDKKKAYDFEKYLKSGSGFAFAKKRLV